MAELGLSTDDDFTGAKAEGPPRPVRVTPPLARRGIEVSLQGRDDDIAQSLLGEDDAQVVVCNEQTVGERHPLQSGSPAAAAKRRALRNQERLMRQQPEVRLAQEAHRSTASSGASQTRKDREKFVPRSNEKVLDVRCLNEVPGRGRVAQSQGEARDLEDPGIALWGGSLEGPPDWLPLPGKQVNGKGERVRWLRHARYGVGTYIDTERLVFTFRIHASFLM
ncbi:hypothetical protein Esti_001055 [Eimeria stiedai]